MFQKSLNNRDSELKDVMVIIKNETFEHFVCILSRPMEDKELIKLVREGRKDTFAELVERYQTGLFRYVYSIVKDSDMADDITQDTFVKAYNSLGSYNPEFAFATWLYRIGHNTALNAIKANQTFSLDEEEVARIPAAVSDASSIEDREAAVRAAVENLPLKYRTVIVLHYWQKKEYAEIAEILDVPIGTVKTWLHRAKAQLEEECRGIIG
jgi:RNA polymerase sigma-70 factor (ECF subfamily)